MEQGCGTLDQVIGLLNHCHIAVMLKGAGFG